jgi:hypothetical protein
VEARSPAPLLPWVALVVPSRVVLVGAFGHRAALARRGATRVGAGRSFGCAGGEMNSGWRLG